MQEVALCTAKNWPLIPNARCPLYYKSKQFWICQWYLGKGNPLCVSRCIPSDHVSFRALSPARDNRTFSRSITNRESVPATPNTPMRISSRPLHGDDFIENKGRSCPCAIQTRKGTVAQPFLGTIPSTKGASPLEPRPTLADWMPPSYQNWTMTKCEKGEQILL